MAPTIHKRHHEELDKPKKNRHVRTKKRKVYHSSSDGENDDSTSFRARDAPVRSPISQKPAVRSILKSSVSKPSQVPLKATLPSDSVLTAQLMSNTALNATTSGGTDSGNDKFGNGEYEQEIENESADSESTNDFEDEDEEEDEDKDEDSDSATMSRPTMRKKRNDPGAFATSMSKILDTKLSSAKRQDPVLSRSQSAAAANKTIASDRLEAKAKAQIRSERKAVSDKGRVKDVLGLADEKVNSGSIMEEEKRLQKTAQRGVVKLFNAVRAAQIKAEEGMRQARNEGVVGMKQREEKVNELSKQGFLDLISRDGKASIATAEV